MTAQEIASCVRTAEEWVRQEKLREAGDLCRKTLRQHPLHTETLHLLGVIEFRTGSTQKALELLKRAVRISPREAKFHNSLGIVFGSINKPDVAAQAFLRAIFLNKDYAEAHSNLGTALAQRRKLPEAERALRRALQLRPDYAESHANLGNVLRKQGKLLEAATEFDEAARRNPKYRETYAGQAMIARDFGDADGAVEAYRRSLAIKPDDAAIHSNLLYAMHYQTGVTSEALFKEHLEFARRHAKPLYREIKPHDNDRNPDRRLRIGYISADFREHPRARFIEPLLAKHDRKQFQIYCYSDAAKPDEFTKRFKGMADVWRETAGMPNDGLAEFIRRDGIDLLIDCTGHMAHNRMLMLARKPAPIQILYPGYPNTSGLKTVDYWITDAYQDPPGLTERFHTEQIVRLEPFARCYAPSDNSPPVGPLPAESNGFITFGALNNPVKNNTKVLAVWSRLMAAVPTARLLVLVGLGAEEAVSAAFARHGIPENRLEIVTRARRDKYLALFNRIDILLDTFPYNGYTTTLDSLWMGVPVLTLASDTNVSRAGVSLLSNASLPEWIATSSDDYLERGIRFAGDIPALSDLRTTLRQRIEASPLMDAAGFIQKMEAAYRMMWKTWCNASPN